MTLPMTPSAWATTGAEPALEVPPPLVAWEDPEGLETDGTEGLGTGGGETGVEGTETEGTVTEGTVTGGTVTVGTVTEGVETLGTETVGGGFRARAEASASGSTTAANPARHMSNKTAPHAARRRVPTTR